MLASRSSRSRLLLTCLVPRPSSSAVLSSSPTPSILGVPPSFTISTFIWVLQKDRAVGGPRTSTQTSLMRILSGKHIVANLSVRNTMSATCSPCVGHQQSIAKVHASFSDKFLSQRRESVTSQQDKRHNSATQEKTDHTTTTNWPRAGTYSQVCPHPWQLALMDLYHTLRVIT